MKIYDETILQDSVEEDDSDIHTDSSTSKTSSDTVSQKY